MPQLSFMKRFVPALENGLAELEGRPLPHPGVRPKRQTIRLVWKYPIRPGQTLQIVTGARTKQYRKLGEAQCTSVEALEIDTEAMVATVVVEERWLPLKDVHALAHADGLRDAAEMVQLFDRMYGLPFEGVLIKW